MAVLRFTNSGLVQGPTTVQIRVTRAYPGRMDAGAPTPHRGLSDEEIAQNLDYFVNTLRSPRTRPCTSLVLSGVELADRRGLAQVLERGRAWGLTRVVLHLGRGARRRWLASPARAQVDGVVMQVVDADDLDDLAVMAKEVADVTAVLRLDHDTVPRLRSLVVDVLGARPRRVVLSWPLGGDDLPPLASEVAVALAGPLELLRQAGVQHGVKGLAACTLGGLNVRSWRSQNRWYVDAEHQTEHALLFFPDVVRFVKTDECRFCVRDPLCDGVPDQWLSHGRCGSPRALSAPDDSPGPR